jgi:hypothetical protein
MSWAQGGWKRGSEDSLGGAWHSEAKGHQVWAQACGCQGPHNQLRRRSEDGKTEATASKGKVGAPGQQRLGSANSALLPFTLLCGARDQ